MQYPESEKRVFKDCVHYVSSSLLSKNFHFIKESPRKVKTILAIPGGIVLTMIIKLKTR